MSLIFGAGIVGLGFLIYENKQSIAYNLLKTYTYLEEKYQERFNPKDKLNLSYFNYNSDNKKIVNSTSSNHNFLIFKFNDVELFLRMYGDKHEYQKSYDDIKKNIVKYTEEKIPIIAITVNITNTDSKTILTEELDVTKIVKPFLYGSRKLKLYKDDSQFWIALINKLNILNIRLNYNYTLEWVVLDNDLNMTKNTDITLSVKDNKLNIELL